MTEAWLTTAVAVATMGMVVEAPVDEELFVETKVAEAFSDTDVSAIRVLVAGDLRQ